MITGAHAILYSTKAEADRAFLRDVLGLPLGEAGAVLETSTEAIAREAHRARLMLRGFIGGL